MITQTVKYLSEVKIFLESIHKEEYTQPIALMSNSSIGQHLRHFIEFYQCLLEQISEGKICYDNRKRDKDIEENPKYALAVLNKIIHKLPHLDIKKKIALKIGLNQQKMVETNINRELLYNLEHTTHHLAIIKIGLALLQSDIKLPEDFGVANSTIQHRKMMEIKK